jgi:ParB family transcriptional regulator, chromosome partitioning protein
MTANQVGLAMLPTDAIRPNPRNVRSEVGDITELAASIRAEGILQPLSVEPAEDSTYTLLWGQRRYAAVQRLGITAVPCIIRQPAGDRRTTARMVIENVHRKDLPPLDEARAYQTLLDDGMTRSEIARATGVSAATITHRLALLELPNAAQKMVRDGRLSLGAAASLGREVKRTGGGTVTEGAQCPKHFDGSHPLARDAKQRCNTAGHPAAGRIGGLACGACWEASIRADVAGQVEQSHRHVQTVRAGFVDEVAVQRAVNGDLSVSLSIAERREAVRLLHRQGYHDRQIACTLGITDRTVIRIREALDLPAVAS